MRSLLAVLALIISIPATASAQSGPAVESDWGRWETTYRQGGGLIFRLKFVPSGDKLAVCMIRIEHGGPNARKANRILVQRAKLRVDGKTVMSNFGFSNLVNSSFRKTDGNGQPSACRETSQLLSAMTRDTDITIDTGDSRIKLN